MRLEKIQTAKQAAVKPHITRVAEGYMVCDVNSKQVKVFEDVDVAKSYMKRHLTELKEGRDPVVYMSEIMEGVLDDTDDDGWMAKSELYKLAKYAISLHGMIQDNDNLEPWVQSKITKAADYISSVKHYMEYMDIADGQPEVIDDLPVVVDIPSELPPEGM
jgi:hypothetical protein|tara:strand:+ start:2197 stop:2679 length:483 start_codon:yes stop_codon:yes gene_type:complete